MEIMSSLLCSVLLHLFFIPMQKFTHANVIALKTDRLRLKYECVLAFQSLSGAHSISNRIFRKLLNAIGVDLLQLYKKNTHTHTIVTIRIFLAHLDHNEQFIMIFKLIFSFINIPTIDVQ